MAADYRGSVTVKKTAISDYCTKKTVVTDYRGSVPSKCRIFFNTVPSKSWRPIAAEAYRANAVVFNYCAKLTVAADYRGSVTVQYRDHE